jgi:hypothetical protein
MVTDKDFLGHQDFTNIDFTNVKVRQYVSIFST